MSVSILTGDTRAILPSLPADSFHCVVTSPPYFGLRGAADGPIYKSLGNSKAVPVVRWLGARIAAVDAGLAP